MQPPALLFVPEPLGLCAIVPAGLTSQASTAQCRHISSALPPG